MYFTRDPVIETIITAKDGHKLVLRNTKIASQEPFIVDSVEVVSLSGGCFFRSSERAQPFFIPISDYDIVEVRDARTTLKLPGIEKGIKIAGGRSANLKSVKEVKNLSIDSVEEKDSMEVSLQREVETSKNTKEEKEGWKKSKKKKVIQETSSETSSKDISLPEDPVSCTLENASHIQVNSEELNNKAKRFSLLPPPPMLISEVINKFSEVATEESQVNDKPIVEDVSIIVE